MLVSKLFLVAEFRIASASQFLSLNCLDPNVYLAYQDTYKFSKTVDENMSAEWIISLCIL